MTIKTIRENQTKLAEAIKLISEVRNLFTDGVPIAFESAIGSIKVIDNLLNERIDINCDLTVIFWELHDCVRKDENYIPRDYQTVGGMWTVDTWKKGDLVLQLMDEGSTYVLTGPNFQFINGFHGGTEHYNGKPKVIQKVGTLQDAIDYINKPKCACVCGNTNTQYVANPYDEDVNNTINMQWLCDSCYEKYKRDI